METHLAYLLLGSNMGQAKLNLKQAVSEIAQIPIKVKAVSSIYQTKAWGKTDQADFLNAALLIETTLEPIILLEKLLEIEHKMGRIRTQKWEERIIDIDILLYDSVVTNSPELTIPHPQIPFRKFTLVPLNQLAPEFIYPGKNVTIKELLATCTDDLAVEEVEKTWI